MSNLSRAPRWEDHAVKNTAAAQASTDETGALPSASTDYRKEALTLIQYGLSNHLWRQQRCVNLIPSEMTQSRAVRLLSASDPCGRYAEHQKNKNFPDQEVFYYQGTKFIGEVERLAAEELRRYLGCSHVELRAISGQMANTATFSALMDNKNRNRRGQTPQRLGYVLNNHIIKGGHLSAQPMGALHDYIAVDPATGKNAVVNFPVCEDNPYKIDLTATKRLIDAFKPELIIFGKSMVLYREPIAEIRQFLSDQKLSATIMYDMAHVLGLVGDHFQNPFAEGADVVTGSTHKTFFGPQRGLIGVGSGDDNEGIWECVQNRVFPGSVSNHHLGTMLGLLMAAYEMNSFKDAYQKNVIHNAKHFAAALHSAGLQVEGDPAISYTETHQVILRVGHGKGPEMAERLERNNVICNYQATPAGASFMLADGLRIGVSEMTRFGFSDAEFSRLAELMADAILRDKDVSDEVAKLRGGFTELQYCFSDRETESALDAFSRRIGF